MKLHAQSGTQIVAKLSNDRLNPDIFDTPVKSGNMNIRNVRKEKTESRFP